MSRLRLVVRQVGRMPSALRRTRELTATPWDMAVLLMVLFLGLLETHVPRLRRRSLYKVRLRRGNASRVLYLRANGSDAFTFFEVFIRQVYQSCLPLQAGQVVLDLGANIGISTAYFRLEGGRDLRVIAVEPEDDNHTLLLRNAPEPEVTVVRAAVTHEPGPLLLAIGLPTGHSITTANTAGPTQLVSGVTLDQLAAAHAVDGIEALKVDIEGAESAVFTKPWNVLQRTRRIVMEVHAEQEKHPIAAALAAQGFEHFPATTSVMPEFFESRGT